MSKTPPDGVLKPELWVKRPISETLEFYTDWAASYDAEVTARGYHTPRRLAEALVPLLADTPDPILDFGCGTGLSGMALRAAGIGPLHGTDVTPAMVAEAEPKRIYDALWVSEPGALDAGRGPYRAIVAAGVISLGAAPPDTMDILVNTLAPGQLLAMSFNDPTLVSGDYDAHLKTHLDAGRLSERFRAHGPHLDDVGMGSDVIVLQKR